jgi:hypothetical protein
MKKILTMFISILLMLVNPLTSYSQKIMKLDDELKANSSPMEVKLKGINILPRYEFGPYRIASGKAEWGKGKSYTDRYSSETYTESSSKSSFVFTVNEKDTILVNTVTIANYSVNEREGFIGDVTTLTGSLDNYTVFISPYNDTTLWKMILVSTTEAKAGGDNAEGILTNGVTTIQIMGIKQWEDGKNTPFRMICGYGFFSGNKEIAAVQSKTNRIFVWVQQDLDEQLKSVLAAASASLMVHTFAGESF